MARREAQLSAVTSEARRQSRDANAALAASQHQVERLEGLAVALRESLGGGNGAAGAAAAVAGLGGAERGELARRFKELRQQLESAQVGGPEGGVRRRFIAAGLPCVALLSQSPALQGAERAWLHVAPRSGTCRSPRRARATWSTSWPRWRTTASSWRPRCARSRCGRGRGLEMWDGRRQRRDQWWRGRSSTCTARAFRRPCACDFALRSRVTPLARARSPPRRTARPGRRSRRAPRPPPPSAAWPPRRRTRPWAATSWRRWRARRSSSSRRPASARAPRRCRRPTWRPVCGRRWRQWRSRTRSRRPRSGAPRRLARWRRTAARSSRRSRSSGRPRRPCRRPCGSRAARSPSRRRRSSPRLPRRPSPSGGRASRF